MIFGEICFPYFPIFFSSSSSSSSRSRGSSGSSNSTFKAVAGADVATAGGPDKLQASLAEASTSY